MAASGVVAGTATTAGATPPTDPLGPALTQVEQSLATAVVNVEGEFYTLLNAVGCEEDNAIWEVTGLLQPQFGPPPCR